MASRPWLAITAADDGRVGLRRGHCAAAHQVHDPRDRARRVEREAALPDDAKEEQQVEHCTSGLSGNPAAATATVSALPPACLPAGQSTIACIVCCTLSFRLLALATRLRVRPSRSVPAVSSAPLLAK